MDKETTKAAQTLINGDFNDFEWLHDPAQFDRILQLTPAGEEFARSLGMTTAGEVMGAITFAAAVAFWGKSI